MKQYKNIDLLQVNITTGISEYQIPQNVSWAGKKVDKIILCAPHNTCLSPIDGQTQVYNDGDVRGLDLYLDIYSDEGLLCQSLHADNISYENNNPIAIDSVISTKLTRLHFAQTPVKDGCLLLYIFYNTTEELLFEPPTKNVTIKFDLQPNEKKTFTELINTYVYASNEKVRGITFWESEANPAYITLRDYNLEHIFNDLHTVMARPQMNYGGPTDYVINPLYFDAIDIDFDYSFIQNAVPQLTHQLMTIQY